MSKLAKWPPRSAAKDQIGCLFPQNHQHDLAEIKTYVAGAVVSGWISMHEKQRSCVEG